MQIADKFAHNPCRSTQNVRQQYDVRTIISRSHARLPHDGRANLQDCCKTERDVLQYPQCSHCAIFSCSGTCNKVMITYKTVTRTTKIYHNKSKFHISLSKSLVSLYLLGGSTYQI